MFKISSFKDSWNNYPFPAEKIEPELISAFVPSLRNEIDETKFYKWKTGNNTYAFIYVIHLKNELVNLKGQNTLSNKENILDEEVYFYNISIEYAGEKENMKLYVFDENKFIFIVGGLWSFPEELTKKLVNTYPSKPSPTNFNLDSYFANQLISSVFRLISSD